MKTYYKDMDDGMIRATEAEEQLRETGCENVDEEVSYDLYYYKLFHVEEAHVGKETKGISDVESYCVIEACGRSQSQTDICDDTHNELSCGEVQSENEKDRPEFDESCCTVNGKIGVKVLNETKQNNPAAKSALVSVDHHGLDMAATGKQSAASAVKPNDRSLATRTRKAISEAEILRRQKDRLKGFSTLGLFALL